MAEEKRKDPKGRNLRNGETYDAASGRYRYSYIDATGKRRQLYSLTLTAKDPIPPESKQKPGESLREKEVQAQADRANQIDATGGNMTVYQLMERYVKLKMPDVRETTRNGYRTQLNYMATDPFGKKKICKVNATEAEEWFDSLHSEKSKGYSSLHTLRGILRPAFAMAKKNRWVVDNPFDFAMLKKRYGGTKTRDALSKADMRRFLDFVRTDKHFQTYFNGVFILFSTGLRISEFCGLIPDDIDFQNHVIHVRRQLLRIHDGDKMLYYIEIPKTDNGIRDVPMLADVETAFREVLQSRPQRDVEPVVWNEEHTDSASGFLWLDKNGTYETAQHWQNHLRWARAKFNRIYKDEIPPVTPHVCRHTFCSNCASIGMNPKTLQMIMGHASIEFTLNVYTHLEAGDIKGEFFSLMNNKAYNFYPLDRQPETVAPDTVGDDDEGDPDIDAAPDDDE
ncbi:MAG: site-specific integrase [Lachnospiraceae bacterium]|nr:site-specific integrase [Lachnospiraceae bacterium]